MQPQSCFTIAFSIQMQCRNMMVRCKDDVWVNARIDDMIVSVVVISGIDSRLLF